MLASIYMQFPHFKIYLVFFIKRRCLHEASFYLVGVRGGWYGMRGLKCWRNILSLFFLIFMRCLRILFSWNHKWYSLSYESLLLSSEGTTYTQCAELCLSKNWIFFNFWKPKIVSGDNLDRMRRHIGFFIAWTCPKPVWLFTSSAVRISILSQI